MSRGKYATIADMVRRKRTEQAPWPERPARKDCRNYDDDAGYCIRSGSGCDRCEIYPVRQ